MSEKHQLSEPASKSKSNPDKTNEPTYSQELKEVISLLEGPLHHELPRLLRFLKIREESLKNKGWRNLSRFKIEN